MSTTIERFAISMKIPRRFTEGCAHPYDTIEFGIRSSEIRNPDGTTIFSMEGVRVPKAWSQVAVDVLVKILPSSPVWRTPDRRRR